MIFILFDRHPLMNAQSIGNRLVMLDKDEIVPEFAGGGNQSLDIQLRSLSGVTPGTPVQAQESQLTSAASDQALQIPWYPDQIPPFEITLVGANEYGAMMKMAIAGAEILNEGSGVSIDDIVTEHEFTYVARSIVPWTAVTPNMVAQVGTPPGEANPV